MAVILCSCGNAADFESKPGYSRTENIYSEEPTAETVTEETSAETETETAETTETVTTTAPPETTTEATVTEPPKPVGLQREALDGHRYTIEKCSHKVYSNTKLKKALGKLDDICADTATV